ncbi:MAG: glycosyl transferase [Planctomycetes bacterium]|nr:glycosyl transferase [Planctomycetota bacterium]
MAAAVVLTLPLAAYLAGPRIGLFTGAVVLSAYVGLCDDRRPLSVRTRFIALVLASLPIMIVSRADLIHLPYLEPFSLGLLAIPLTLLWLTGFANAFNFMDGINGIAGLTAGISGLGFALAGLWANDSATALLGAVTAGATLGFLPWNFPRAKIFMGDAGSLPLGLLLAGTALVAARQRGQGLPVTLPFPAGVQILGPFLFDVIFTLGRRALHGKRIGAAHREHLYQRLSRQWGSHTPVSVLYGAFSVITVALALLYAGFSDLGKLISLTLSVLAMSLFAQRVLSRDRPLSAETQEPA